MAVISSQLIAASHLFHALEFFVERKLLVVVIVLEAMSEFERGREALQQGGQLLHGGEGGVVVGGLAAALGVFVDECLLSGEGQALVMVGQRPSGNMRPWRRVRRSSGGFPGLGRSPDRSCRCFWNHCS